MFNSGCFAQVLEGPHHAIQATFERIQCDERHSDVTVLVDKNRVRAGQYAISRLGCDTLILDDGFQYLPLKHRLDIVLVDRTNPFGNRNLLPRGILREPVRNIKRASFIFITNRCDVGRARRAAPRR